MNAIGPIEAEQLAVAKAARERLMGAVNYAEKSVVLRARQRVFESFDHLKSIASIVSHCAGEENLTLNDYYNSNKFQAMNARRKSYYLMRKNLHIDTLSVAVIYRKTEATVYKEIDIYLQERTALEMMQ